MVSHHAFCRAQSEPMNYVEYIFKLSRGTKGGGLNVGYRYQEIDAICMYELKIFTDPSNMHIRYREKKKRYNITKY